MSDKNFIIGATLVSLLLSALLGLFAYVKIGLAEGTIAFGGGVAAFGCAITATYFWTK